MERIGIDERRARLAVRHHVAPAERVDDLLEAVRGVVCLHATDPSTVYLSAWARTTEPSIAAVDRALYEDRRLVRMLAMRRTMFVVDVEEAPILHAAASRAVARGERKRNEQLVAMLGVDDVGRWMREAEEATLAELERRGEATAQELTRDVPALREKVRVSIGKKYEASLVERWLARFGPGTEADIRWWTGWTAREVRAALASIGAVEVDLDGQPGLALAGDLEPTRSPGPWVALLPSLDPTTMGWQGRDWYLGDHKAALFDTSGNAGPTIWTDGRIVGGWAIRANGDVVTKLLEDLGRETEAAIDAEAARLTAWLEAVSTIPRFPTPLQKELTR